MSLYFAYGPEMARDALGNAGEPAAPILFIGKADGYQLRFLSQADERAEAADIVPQDGAAVWGAVFEISDSVKPPDAAVPMSYHRVKLPVTVQTKDGKPVQTSDGRQIVDGSQVEALSYRAGDQETEPASPSEPYLRRMLEGALKRELPWPYVQGLLSFDPAGHQKGQGNVADDIQLGKKDGTQMEIVQIYSKAPPRYAVYRTSDRVSVQFADDVVLAKQQRRSMSLLNTLRSQINGLISGWSRSSQARYRAKAEKYERRVAAALVLGLEDDATAALAGLNDVKDDVIAERTSRGRFEYLIAASVVTAVAVALLLLIHSMIRGATFMDWGRASQLLFAAEAGTVGAFFSIALAIRNRTVLTNLHRWDNISDAVLRIVIGIIAATILVSMLSAEVLTNLTIGGAKISGDNIKWETLLVVGFVAGFLERLVPDLLQKAEPQTNAGGGTPANPPAAGAKKTTSAATASSSDAKTQPPTDPKEPA